MFSKKLLFTLLGLIFFVTTLTTVCAIEQRPDAQLLQYYSSSSTKTNVADPYLFNDSNFNTYANFATRLFGGSPIQQTNIQDLVFSNLPANASQVKYIINLNVSSLGSGADTVDGFGGLCYLNSTGSKIKINTGTFNNYGVQSAFNITFSGLPYEAVRTGTLTLDVIDLTADPCGLISSYSDANTTAYFFENWISYSLDNTPSNISEIRNSDDSMVLTNGVTINSTVPSRSYTFRVNNTEDAVLKSCWYSLNGGTNTTYSCTKNVFSSATVGNIPSGSNTITFYAMNDVGFTATKTLNFNFFMYGIDVTSQSYEDPVLENSAQAFAMNVTYDSSYYTSISATLIYNGTSYFGIKTGSGENVSFSTNVISPNVASDQNVSFYWTVGLFRSGSTTYFNSTSLNQTVLDFNIDNCSSNTVLLYNFSLKDENTRELINGTALNSSIEVDLTLSTFGTENAWFNYHNTYFQENPAQLCSNIDLIDTVYRVDMVSSYVADSYVEEFYFVDNGTLQNASIPYNLDFHDLPLADSTTFLFTFLDESGLEVPGTIVHTLRYYIGEGDPDVEVERSKQDNNGQTHIHLVEEDVIYQFNITLEGRQIFLSAQYNAKCLSTPCAITLSAEPENLPFPTNYDNLPEGTYTVYANKTSRDVTLLFNLNQTATMNLSIWTENNNEANIVASDTITASGGELIVNVPVQYGNMTYYAVIYMDGEFIASRVIDLTENGSNYFGPLGLFLGAIAILCLALIGASHGEWVIIWTVLGMITASTLFLVDLEWYALVTFIAGASVFVAKLIARRRVQ